jgi:predicted transcriptional regulator
MTISVRLSDKDTKLIKAYADMNNISISDLIRNAVIEKIEDEYDLNALKDYERRKNNGELELYDHDEVWSKL